MDNWSPLKTAPRDRQIFILDATGRVWLAEWDDDSGYFFGALASEPNDDITVESPGRIYSAGMWRENF